MNDPRGVQLSNASEGNVTSRSALPVFETFKSCSLKVPTSIFPKFRFEVDNEISGLPTFFPLPATETSATVFEFTTIDKFPLKLPSLFGVNEVVTLMPDPGLMSLGNDGEVTSNALLLLVTLLTLIVDEPSFSIVKLFVSVLFTST